MANISAADVKKLRDLTSAGMMDCKKALTEADGDFDKAVEILRVHGQAKAEKRGAERTATAGLVAASGTAMVELNSETDFVAKSDEFVATAQQIADAAAEATAREEGKPEGALPKIVEGRVNGFYKDVVLLEQASVQESKKTVKAVLDEAGVTVKRFARFEVGA